MELLYLWINCGNNNCIIQQEMNFSPIYNFYVDNKENPTNLKCEKMHSINLLAKGSINNITAIIGSNGVGKTSLLSFIANKSCYPKFNRGNDYSKYDLMEYEHHKSIYVFLDNKNIIVYHNLENELNCEFDILPDNIYWVQKKEDSVERLHDIRKQLIMYITNSSFVPDGLQNYSQSGSTWNVNMHPKSMNLIANRFYNLLFGVKDFKRIKENDSEFAWLIKEHRDERTFQELLDVLYYQYLISNKTDNIVGVFKDKIRVSFETIFDLMDDKYHNDFEIIEDNNTVTYSNELVQKYYDKRKEFFKQYDVDHIEKARRKNTTIILYVNLLFEVFFYDSGFKLPDIDFSKSINKQLKKVFVNDNYKNVIEEINEINKILSKCKTNENSIENPDDFACNYDKIICKENVDFFNFIKAKFESKNSFTLKYIRINNLKMSSGERAMQNMFSWIALLPKLDDIMGIIRSEYTSKLLLIDEIDLYSHPEWQRKVIYQLINIIKNVEEGSKPIQIIITSHSPLIISDFPQQNIIYLNKHKGKTFISESKYHKQSFGANLYTLLNDAFFLENGTVGEFAKSEIIRVYNELSEYELSTNACPEYYQDFINVLGDNLVKKELRRLYYKKFGAVDITPNKEEKINTDELKKIKSQLESSLAAVNDLLGE